MVVMFPWDWRDGLVKPAHRDPNGLGANGLAESSGDPDLSDRHSVSERHDEV
jgi:hypothetical protein